MATYIKKDFASPNGPILLLSAKGSTTASIAEANGVKDFSGNGNHGQAYGTTTVNASNDEFVFDGSTASKIDVTNSSFLSAINGKSAYSLSITAQCTDSSHPRTGGLISNSSTGYLFGFIYITITSIVFNDRMSSSSESIKQLSIYISNLPAEAVSTNGYYAVTATVDYTSGVAVLYVNGVEVSRSTNWFKGTKANVTALRLGQSSANSSYTYSGFIKHARVYDRVLSAAEVKYLYNGFQPNLIMGQTIPSGAILNLSARGLTTSGIAQANGVVDRSGNGNHGQAYNGVAVVNDDEMGSCFSFDGTAVKKITFSNTYPISTNAITLAVTMRHLGRGGGGDGYNAIFGNNMVLCYSPAGSICLQLKNNSSGNAYRIDTVNNATLVDGNIHSLIGIMYIENNICYLQTSVDGVLQSPSRTLGSSSQSTLFNGMGNILIGELTTGTTYKSNVQLSDIRIYPRALTASEVQQLADASLKKITNIKSGSSDVRQIFSNGEMIYAKTNDYSLNL